MTLIIPVIIILLLMIIIQLMTDIICWICRKLEKMNRSKQNHTPKKQASN
ncbi:hypothetical protein WR164_14450 [Philodulcilactobacillus myokoensis]|uniref:Uncharacterized protein n=1 Tax=Philodulcilactobacillus myokoensis TaxID=2929573 RepID=A0A9W6ESW0_9LACO|nr:hypothetical protein [Philodulcilactobacillus myokoensis]GLB47466.1 hypothetical protein WR164_14450 [Philodulcilactobacillus myokoensis]